MDSGPVIYEQRGRVDEHKSRPDGRRHRSRGQVRISGAFPSELRTDSRSESRRGYSGRHARESADARSSTRAIAPAWPALANGEHLCEAILIERDRLYASKLIPLIAQQHPHILYVFVHTKMFNWEPPSKVDLEREIEREERKIYLVKGLHLVKRSISSKERAGGCRPPHPPLVKKK